jgi:type VI protein secretion system component VasF
MDWLEQELKQALQRKDPSPEFAERVKRAARGDRFRTAMWPGRWLAAAAAILVMAGGAGYGYRQHQGNVAKQQVMLAFRIAGAEVNHIQSQVRGLTQ